MQGLTKTKEVPAAAKMLATRIASIDILRALTMVLMIFVNDLWTIKDAPDWMKHVERGVDGMGLADVVYPAFIFIVGMSLYFAVVNRREKGGSTATILRHVAERTAALLIMGLFLVNGEMINGEATGIARPVWNVLCCLAFILIWNFYPKEANKKRVYALRSIGLAALLVLAILYRGGVEGTDYFGIHWWGILGGIAWAYFAAALVLVLGGNNIYAILGGWLFFCALSIAGKAGIVPHDGILAYIPNPIRGGTFAGLAMGGVLASFIFHQFSIVNNRARIFLALTAFTLVLIALALYTRPFWGISKLSRTPAWLFLCSALTIIGFLIIYWVADIRKRAAWFDIVKPAGTDTLLCYLVPYFLYAAMRLSGFKWPELLAMGSIGLLKSGLFALLCVWITRTLNRQGIRLKL
jgi:predicted acyltransferase